MEIEECLELLLDKADRNRMTEKISISDAYGRICAEDVYSSMMVPPFPKSAMDGYAVRASETAGISKENPGMFKVLGELCAGDYAEFRQEPMAAVRVMTGAYVPEGFDAVIRQEDTDYGENEVTIYHEATSFSNYCRIGEEAMEGQKVVSKGTCLTAVHIGLLASVGISEIQVSKPVRTAIISTGTELCCVGEKLSPGKIYNNIAYMLQASIRKEGLEVVSVENCTDDESVLIEKIKNASEKSDIMITTGAVSVGKKDIIPSVTEKLGAKVIFRRARIQPGTPTMASCYNGKILLNLSGNPFAALANFELYYWPLAAKMMNNEKLQPLISTAVLDCRYDKINKTRRLIRAYAAGGKVIIPSDVHSSSVIHNLTECNCFIDLEADRAVKPGDMVRIRYFKG